MYSKVIVLTMLAISCFGENQPHLILIVADDLGWNDVSWHNEQVITPHLDDLAKSGVILEQSYVQPICTPTRSALMTGRYPYTLGRQHGVLSPFMPTGLTLNATILPEYLKKQGYTTHAVGKWHLGFCSWDYTPTHRGFDTFHGYYNGAEDYYSHSRSEYIPSGANITDHTEGYDFRSNEKPDLSAKGTYSAYDFARHVEDLVENRSAGDPMFLYMAFQSVHAPLMVPSNYSDLYKHIHDLDRRTYLGMVTAMDEAVGGIVDALKDTGHYNNCVIVFTTDNGGPTRWGGNNYPLRGNKSTLWEGGTRGTAFIHSPLLLKTNNTISNQLIHVTDWFATFISLAGGEVPSDIDGVDQWASLSNGLPSPRTEFIYNIDAQQGIRAGIRLGDYKLLVGDPGDGDWIPPPEIVFNESDLNNTLHNILEQLNITTDNTSTLHNILEQLNITTDNTSTSHDINRIFNRTTNNNYALHDIIRELNITTERISTLQYTTEKLNKTANHTSHDVAKYLNLTINCILQNITEHFNTTIDAFKSKTINKTYFKQNNTTVNTQLDYFTETEERNDIWSQITMLSSNTKQKLDEERTKRDVNFVHIYSNDDDNEQPDIDVLPFKINTNASKDLRLQDDSIATEFDVVEPVLQCDIPIYLFNLKDDPNERNDISEQKPYMTKKLLRRLMSYLTSFVPADLPDLDYRADPKNFGGVWSPGWC